MERRDENFKKKRLLSKFEAICSEDEETTQYHDTIVPILSENSSIPCDILQFDYSFGYNCKKLSNLCLIDRNTLVFASGNLIHFLNLSRITVTVRRSEQGIGIGSIAVNPKYNYLTVGENGENPAIYLYEYPRMTIVAKLVGGGKATISSLAYSNNGEMLASQSGLPDLLLTIWNWRQEKIILQQKSFSNLVFNLRFSTVNDMTLTTCGAEHIKFWKMCHTFTGLKLKGQLGRFGKTKICDIYGILAIEEDKVLSGCDWGNILVWEKGRIQYEVCRKNRRPCHSAPITQILWQNGEVLTISLDGYAKVWYWDSVESASPCEDDEAFIEIEPLYEYFIGNENHTSELISLWKKNPLDPVDFTWLAQDGNGGIWLCDISPEPFPQPPIEIFKCHAGEIAALSTSPATNHIATLGHDGRLHIYHYQNYHLILQHQFKSHGRDMIWLPLDFDPSGRTIIAAFEDGALRMIYVDFSRGNLCLFQVIKGHRESIKALSLNSSAGVLASGSKDHTVFIHKLSKSEKLVSIEPLGLVKAPSEVNALTWNPANSMMLIIGCREGEVLHVKIPENPKFYTENTFFMSNIEIQELQCLPKKKEIQIMKRITEVWYKKAIMKEFIPRYAPKTITKPPSDEQEDYFMEKFTASFQKEEEEIEIKEPDPGQIIWIKFIAEDSFWIAMSGDECGFIYEYKFNEEFNPVRCIDVPHAEDLEVSSYLHKNNSLIFGLSDGSIRITKILEDFRSLTDYWQLVMHSNEKGKIRRLATSHDEKYLFSVGEDGNIFSYRLNCPEGTQIESETQIPCLDNIEEIPDQDFTSVLSLEEEKQKISDELREKESQIKKEEIRDILTTYREKFRDVIERNSQLPEDQRIGESDELYIDERINRDLQNSLDREMNLLKRKMAFDVGKAKLASTKMMSYFIDPLETYPIEVAGLNTPKSVKSFRIQKLNEDYFACKTDLERRILLDVEKITTKEQRLSIELNRNIGLSQRPVEAEGEGVKLNRIESFLKDLTETKSTFNLHMKMRRLLNKYQERKSREMERKREWETVIAQKPNINVNHPDDEQALSDAKATIGDYKLKTDLKHIPTDSTHNMLLDKYEEILKMREEIFLKKNEYNEKIFTLRQQKADLVACIRRQGMKLTEIHKEIQVGDRKFISDFNSINEKLEYPEISLKLVDHHDIISISRGNSDKELEDRDDLGQDVDIDSLEREILYHSGEIKEFSFEAELQKARMSKKLFEQEQLTEEISERIKDFDDHLIQLDHERLSVELDVKFLEIHLLTLNEELEILRDFQDKEMSLTEQVDAEMLENSQLLGTIMSHETKLEALKKNLHRLKEEEKIFHVKFQESCSESRFFKILKGIFEGKHDGSMDFPITICSIDGGGSQECSFRYDDETIDEYEKELYHFVLQLRKQLLANSDNQLIEQQNIMQTKVTLEKLTETIKDVQRELMEKQENLLKSKREKQKLLNEVKTVVVLRMDQLQYFRGSDFESVQKTLLFTNENVAKLYARVGQLAVETTDAKRKHRVNIVHLSRLKTDCHSMENEIAQLKMDIKSAMIKKFGMTVNLDELQEAVLRRLVYEIRLNVDSIAEDFDRKAAEQKRILSEKKIDYIRVIREGTDKLNILTVLQEEQNFLRELLAHQEKIRENRKTRKQIDFSKDLEKLKEISKQQKIQIESLQREIRTLSLKCKPFGSLGLLDPIETPRDRMVSFEQKGYEDSIYASVVDSLPNSDRGRSPDFLLAMEITNIVNAFLQKSLGKRFGEKQVKRCCENLTKYFMNVAKNFDYSKSEELLPCIVQDFHAYLPDECRWAISAADIANVFERIITKLRSDENDVDFKDVISGIVENSVEIVTVTGVESSYTNALITEIFRQICVTLQLSDFTDKNHINLLVDAVTTISDMNLHDINMNKIVHDVEEFAMTNLTDDIDSNFIRALIESFVNKLKNKFS
ncbi:uncharacterized protein DMENIID0001_083410 [Sergentomyia squamirostris]